MVRVTGHRNGEFLFTRESTSGAAVVSMLRFELGYGGSVPQFDDVSITTRTKLFDNIDMTRFSGTAAEIKPLLLGYHCYLEILGKKEIDGQIVNNAIAGLGTEAGLPFHVVNTLPVFIGKNRVRLAAALVTCKTEEDAFLLLELKDEDEFWAAVELQIDTDASVKEIVS